MNDSASLKELEARARLLIDAAFVDGRHLRRMGSKTALAIDAHAEFSEREAAKAWDQQFELVPWRELPRGYLSLGLYGIVCLDAESLCSMLPAFMVYLLDTKLQREEKEGVKYWFQEGIMREAVVERLNGEERAAILAFLEWAVRCEREEAQEGEFERWLCERGEFEGEYDVASWLGLVERVDRIT